MSTLLNLGFKNLTNTQIVAFILGVTFSILAVAAIFFAFKHASKTKSKVKIILATMVMPFIAISAWLILIFSFVDGFKQDDVLNIFVSIALSIVICFMILMVSYVLYRKHKDEFKEESETVTTIDDSEETEEETPAEDVVVAVIPALPENVDEVIVEENAEEIVDGEEVDAPESTTALSEEESEETEEETEEVVEENAEDATETETEEEPVSSEETEEETESEENDENLEETPIDEVKEESEETPVEEASEETDTEETEETEKPKKDEE